MATHFLPRPDQEFINAVINTNSNPASLTPTAEEPESPVNTTGYYYISEMEHQIPQTQTEGTRNPAATSEPQNEDTPAHPPQPPHVY